MPCFWHLTKSWLISPPIIEPRISITTKSKIFTLMKQTILRIVNIMKRKAMRLSYEKRTSRSHGTKRKNITHLQGNAIVITKTSNLTAKYKEMISLELLDFPSLVKNNSFSKFTIQNSSRCPRNKTYALVSKHAHWLTDRSGCSSLALRRTAYIKDKMLTCLRILLFTQFRDSWFAFHYSYLSNNNDCNAKNHHIRESCNIQRARI